MSVCLSLSPFLCLSVSLSISLSVLLAVCMSVCLSVPLSISPYLSVSYSWIKEDNFYIKFLFSVDAAYFEGMKKVLRVGEEKKELVDPYLVFSFAGKSVSNIKIHQNLKLPEVNRWESLFLGYVFINQCLNQLKTETKFPLPLHRVAKSLLKSHNSPLKSF